MIKKQEQHQGDLQFSLYIASVNLQEFDRLGIPKVTHNPINLRKLKQQLVIDKNTGKHFICIAMPICIDRTSSNGVYSLEKFKTNLYRLHQQANGANIQLRIDIIPTGTLDRWNIARDKCLADNKGTPRETFTPTRAHEDDLEFARLEGQNRAYAWEKSIQPLIADLISKGHDIKVKHWPSFFQPRLDSTEAIKAKLMELYLSKEDVFNFFNRELIRIDERSSSQGKMVIPAITKYYNLHYLIEELVFQFWILISTDQNKLYDFHYYEMDRYAPILTEIMVKYARELANNILPNGNIHISKLLEFNFGSQPVNIPIANARSTFVSNMSEQISPEAELARIAEKLRTKQTLTMNEYMIYHSHAYADYQEYLRTLLPAVNNGSPPKAMDISPTLQNKEVPQLITPTRTSSESDELPDAQAAYDGSTLDVDAEATEPPSPIKQFITYK